LAYLLLTQLAKQAQEHREDMKELLARTDSVICENAVAMSAITRQLENAAQAIRSLEGCIEGRK